MPRRATAADRQSWVATAAEAGISYAACSRGRGSSRFAFYLSE
jgi:hypothetical protein